MPLNRDRSETLGTGDYFQLVSRRKWLVLQTVILVPAAAVLFSLWQERSYKASADLLLNRQNLAGTVSGVEDPSLQDPDRYVQTQVELARSVRVAERVLDATGITSLTAGELLGKLEVSGKENTDILEFSVVAGERELAIQLATEYAQQFVFYRRELDTVALRRARESVEEEIDELRATEGQRTVLYASLVEKAQQLRTMEALQESKASLVRPATGAQQVAPRPIRDGALGLVVGLVIGLGLAFLLEAVDTRVRSGDEIGDLLDLPLLARLPDPPREFRKGHRLVTLGDPHGAQAEAFRILRTNLDLANLDYRARAIMVTSALDGEGKSTVAANLAVTLARAGRRIVLVDLDLRRPRLVRFLDLEGRAGLTDVALGHVELEEAITPVMVAGPDWTAAMGRNGEPGPEGLVLDVLTSGPLPPDPGEFVSSRALGETLRELQRRSELILIDSPPLLQVGDAMALSARVDGLIVVTRLGAVRRPLLLELRRVLKASPAAKLGYIVTGAEAKDAYGETGYPLVSSRPEARERVL